MAKASREFNVGRPLFLSYVKCVWGKLCPGKHNAIARTKLTFLRAASLPTRSLCVCTFIMAMQCNRGKPKCLKCLLYVMSSVATHTHQQPQISRLPAGMQPGATIVGSGSGSVVTWSSACSGRSLPRILSCVAVYNSEHTQRLAWWFRSNPPTNPTPNNT